MEKNIITVVPVNEDEGLDELVHLSEMDHENCGGKIKATWEKHKELEKRLVLTCQRCKASYPLNISMNGTTQNNNTALTKILKGYSDYAYFWFYRIDYYSEWQDGRIIIYKKSFRTEEKRIETENENIRKENLKRTKEEEIKKEKIEKYFMIFFIISIFIFIFAIVYGLSYAINWLINL
jgi:hypothetical protein